MADPDTAAPDLSRVDRRELREFLKAVNLFEKAGCMDAATAARWRHAVHLRAAELHDPMAEA